jgi:hypothetical protein
MKYEVYSLYGTIDIINCEKKEDALNLFAQSKGFKNYDQESFRTLGVLDVNEIPMNRRMKLIAEGD